MTKVEYVQRRDVANVSLPVAATILKKRGYKFYQYQPFYRDAIICQGMTAEKLPFEWSGDHLITSNSVFVKDDEMLTLDIEFDGKTNQSKTSIKIVNADNIIEILYINNISKGREKITCPTSMQITVTAPGSEFENVSLYLKPDQFSVNAYTTREVEDVLENKIKIVIEKERKISIWRKNKKNTIEYLESCFDDYRSLYLSPDETINFDKLLCSGRYEFWVNKKDYNTLGNSIINSERCRNLLTYVLSMINKAGIDLSINNDFMKSYPFFKELYVRFAAEHQNKRVDLIRYAAGPKGQKYPYSTWSSNATLSGAKMEECDFSFEKGFSKSK